MRINPSFQTPVQLEPNLTLSANPVNLKMAQRDSSYVPVDMPASLTHSEDPAQRVLAEKDFFKNLVQVTQPGEMGPGRSRAAV